MKISILVITYNHEKYIRQALESILQQRDYSDAEIFLCDDFSTDNTVSIAKDILTGIGNATIYVNDKNLGITRNYKESFARCNGEYIFILEGDDYWVDPYKIRKQTSFMDAHPYCSMCAHFFIIQNQDSRVFNFPEKIQMNGFILFDGKDLILDEGIISNFSTCCYRRGMLSKISPATYETISYEWMINISIAEFGFLARINEPMSVYRHSVSGLWSAVPLEKQLRGTYDIISTYDRILGNRYHQFFEQKKVILNNRLKELTITEKRSVKKYFPSFLISLYKKIID